MSTTCEISLSENRFYSGQVLAGVVKLNLKKQKTIREFFVQITGKTKVILQRGRSATKKECFYLDSKLSLAKGKCVNENVTLMLGTHQYEFELFIPENMPSTFKWSNGYTRCRVCLFFQTRWQLKQLLSTDVNVIKPLDLNVVPSLRQPVANVQSKSLILCCFPCCPTLHFVKLTMMLPVSGYVPQQIIQFGIIDHKRCDYPIKRFVVELLKNITYSNKEEHKFLQKMVLAQHSCRVSEKYEEEKILADISIPDTQPTDTTSKYIKIEYSIKITAMVDNCYNKIKFHVPITIGSKALEQYPC